MERPHTPTPQSNSTRGRPKNLCPKGRNDKKIKEMEKFGYETANGVNYELLKEFATTHRKHPTQAEYALWTRLRAKQLGVRFRQQHIIGDYIADFVVLEKKLIVEVDGGYHSLPEIQISDAQRTSELEAMGYSIIRFNNNEIISNIENVISKIKQVL